jgi:O-antigen/teichoic acid export membrane protein
VLEGIALSSTSIKSRFLISVISNVARASVTFISGILIARGLNPSGYGELTFLLGSFVAIRALFDMGSSSAFYTFISRNPKGINFFIFYFAWLALQFIITSLLVAWILPDTLFEKIWLGEQRKTVLLAFIAVFFQQQLWQMIGQIGESARQTVMVQLLNTGVSITYLIMVVLVIWLHIVTVKIVLWLIIFTYSSALIVSYYVLSNRKTKYISEEITFLQMISDYWAYCKPMIGLAIAGFVYSFAEKWMLQKYGGSEQQGLFQIASQFAQVSLIATISILNIFWKEIAEATARNDQSRVALLYRKINRGLVMLSAILAGLLLPWSRQIVEKLLGQTYADAWPVLAIMFLYPIHQSMGQLGATMFMAGGNTRKYVQLSISIMLFALPVSYFALAPNSGTLIPGLGMGAIGMAASMVITGILAVNIQALVIARHYGWQFDWRFQVVGIPLMITLGYISFLLVDLVWELNGVSWVLLLIPMLVTGAIYLSLVASAIWIFPWLIGLDRQELLTIIFRLKKLINNGNA